MAPGLLTIRTMGRRRARRESPAGIEGSLCYLPARKLLDICRRQRLTGTLRITSWDRSGHVLVRAGQIAEATYGALQGGQALAEMQALRDGSFELRQHLPALASGQRRGDRVALSALVSECRERALSCRITARSHGRQAVLTFRAGALEELRIDSERAALEPAAVDQALAPFERGQVRVEALPVSLHEPAIVRSGEISPASRPAPRAPQHRPALRAPQHQATPAAPRPPHAQRGARPGAGRATPPTMTPGARPPMARPAPGAMHRAASTPARPGGTRQPVPGAAHEPVAAGQGPGPGRVQPWIDRPGLSGATASLRGTMSGRRELAVIALLALFVLSLAVVIGFVAFRM